MIETPADGRSVTNEKAMLEKIEKIYMEPYTFTANVENLLFKLRRLQDSVRDESESEMTLKERKIFYVHLKVENHGFRCHLDG